ncbi:MAG: DUF4167 domain-containing protein [Sphingomonas sp.]|uniref:DUF4167 domain-containing protein n=1 Tax=Sphingomonas sp. TaxID=28214 RepID=UPI0035A8E0CF|nr:DUF4167 domain-containing protein [Sphingomonas sp.]
MINNRQAGRRRGRGGQRSQGGGNPGRGPESGNRIDNRARGNAAQLLEKYKTLARDAQMQGDRVNTEYYLQFADHYFRVLAETRSRFEESQPRRNANDQFDDGDDEDFDGNSDSMADDRVDPYQADRGNDRGDRGDRNGNRDGDRNGNREAGNRDAVGREGGNRENGNRENGNRDGGNRANGRDQNRDQNRDAGPREGYARRDPNPRDSNPRDNGAERHPRRYQADVVTEPAPQIDQPASAPVEAEADRPRRGRPRRTPVATDAAPRGGDEGGFDADRLPPSLSVSAVIADDDAPATEEKPRRRRRVATSETSAAE